MDILKCMFTLIYWIGITFAWWMAVSRQFMALRSEADDPAQHWHWIHIETKTRDQGLKILNYQRCEDDRNPCPLDVESSAIIYMYKSFDWRDQRIFGIRILTYIAIPILRMIPEQCAGSWTNMLNKIGLLVGHTDSYNRRYARRNSFFKLAWCTIRSIAVRDTVLSRLHNHACVDKNNFGWTRVEWHMQFTIILPWTPRVIVGLTCNFMDRTLQEGDNAMYVFSMKQMIFCLDMTMSHGLPDFWFNA